MNTNFKKMVLISTVLCFAILNSAQADEIDNYILSTQQRKHVPSFSIAVVQGGKVVKEKSYGMANVEQSSQANPNTVYQLASVTKQFTATAIMMLINEGKLSLDDKITNILPDLPTTWDGVTVRNLLNHTSGIKNFFGTRDLLISERTDFTHSEIIDLIGKEPLEFNPGEKWKYSNTGYFLLGMIIEKVTDETYNEFLAERIFKPLGMTNTRVNDLQAIIPSRAQGYIWTGYELRNSEYVSPTQPFAAGSLVSTISDLLKWDKALTTERLLRRSTLEKMWTPTPLSYDGTESYGFGWEIAKVNGHRLVSHGGSIRGFSTQISRYVDDHLTVIVLSNADNGDTRMLAENIAQHYIPALANPKPHAAKTVAGPHIAKIFTNVLNSYIGFYDTESIIRTITAHDGRLYLSSSGPGAEPLELMPISDDTFYLNNPDVDPEFKFRLTFVRSAQGRMKKFASSVDGKSMGDGSFLGPLTHNVVPQHDPNPILTQSVAVTLRIFAKGAKSTDRMNNITAGLKTDFGGLPLPELFGIQSITYLACQNVADQGIVRHRSKVSRILYYKLRTDRVTKYILIYLTDNDLITDEDVVET